jgi:bacterioferritin-associated ferredoxin
VASVTFDVAVVGGGLAGISAAIAAAEAGARTVLFDERPAPDPDGLVGTSPEPLLPRAAAAGAALRHGSLVWGIFGGRRLAVLGTGAASDVHAEAVVLATGSVTVTEPSPGWTQPDIRLALMAESAAGYSAALGGWNPGRTCHLETTVPGVYVAGDCAGLCHGPDVAEAEGRLAGLSAALGLGFGGASTRDDAVGALERIAPERVSLVAGLDAWYVQGSLTGIPLVESYADNLPKSGGVVQGEQAGDIVCPCEGVRESAILAAIAEGARSLNDVKRRTRAGMGVCQGVQCGHPIRMMICAQTGIDPARVPPMTSRPPVRLLRLADLAGLAGTR